MAEFCQRQPWCVKGPGHPGDCHETLEERRARARRSAMRDHPFAGEGQYCEHWSGSSRTTEHGTLSFRSQCGWLAETHPLPLVANLAVSTVRYDPTEREASQ
jgi:hypothetical protein